MDNSLLTAVFIGVLLVWALAEIYGWPQSGLVVPGYLAAVFAIQPHAGVVILVEAAATWGISLAIARGLPRFLPLQRAFGRDRFFLILLVSVLVRLVVEGGPLQSGLALLGFQLETPLHSLGLVLVPLTANAMWNAGFFRGVPYVGIPVLLVFLLLQYVLLPHTNLSFSNFELTYENLSLDFLAAPRAYMLLLMGAFLGAYLGVRYGWDSGGIIIPGLLAIIWMQPAKMVATMAEVVVIVLVVRLLVALPPLKTANLTGMRPLVGAFTVGYVVKLVVSATAGERYPGLRITDLFGFGYLLPSLIAVRCWRYGSFPRVIVPTLLTSLLAFMFATGAGLAMEWARPLPEEAAPPVSSARIEGPAVRAVVAVVLAPSDSPDPESISELRDAFHLATQQRPFGGRHLQVDTFADGAVLHANEENLFGAAWLRPGASASLTILVPQAHAEPGLAEAGVVLAEVLDARCLLLSPSPHLVRQAARETDATLHLEVGALTSVSVAGRLPAAVDFNRLSRVVPSLAPDWELDRSRGIDVLLALAEEDLLSVVLRRYDGALATERPPLYREQGLPMVVDQDQATPTTIELMALARTVVRPLLKARSGQPDWARLAAANAAAMGMQVYLDDESIALFPDAERAPPRTALWLSRHTLSDTVFEVRAARRHYMAAEVARTWWAGTGASALLVHDAGADLDAEAMRRADAWSPELIMLRELVLEHPGSMVISVAAYGEDEYPGVDAVISTGRPLAASDRVPDELLPVRQLVEAGGGTVGWYDGSLARLRFYDPTNARREMVRNTGGHYATIYLSPLYRLRFASPTTSTVLRTMLEGARIPMHEARLADLLAADALPTDVGRALFLKVLDSINRHTTTGHPGELGRLRRRAAERGLSVWAFVDPLDGLPYLVAENHQARLVTPLGRGRGELAPGQVSPSLVRIEGFAAALVRAPGKGRQP